MSYNTLNGYRIMWLFVFFDLPVVEPKQRKLATQFRKTLLKDGFTMLQYSVYIRSCASKESLLVHQKRIKDLLPPDGHVSMLHITDKQYGDIKNFWSRHIESLDQATYHQLELF